MKNKIKYTKFSVLGLLLLTLMSCTTVPDDIILQRNSIVVLPRAESVSLSQVQFESAVIDGDSYFIMTPENYQKLSINVGKIITYSKNNVSIIEKYEEMIIRSNTETELNKK